MNSLNIFVIGGSPSIQLLMCDCHTLRHNELLIESVIKVLINKILNFKSVLVSSLYRSQNSYYRSFSYNKNFESDIQR